MTYKIRSITLALLLASLTTTFFPTNSFASRCLLVSSYHQGYEWSDGVERGVRQTLAGKCELRQFDMDTKRNRDMAFIEQSATNAKAIIEEWKPDVVITIDDNAAKYLIVPYYKNQGPPFVFSGINWTVKEYGFPFENVTGMVEVAPIEPMLSQAQQLISSPQKALYLGADTLTERKNLARFETAATKLGLILEHSLVSSKADWITKYRQAQNKYDFLIIGSNAGIDDWDDVAIAKEVEGISQQLSFTNHGWMMPVTMLGFTKVPEEHGEWAAKAALSIMAGTKPSDIPIIANRRWDLWVNQSLLDATSYSLPTKLLSKAKKVAQ